MRNPRPEAFDPKTRKPKPAPINLAGIIPLTSKPPVSSQTVFSQEQQSEPHDEVVSRYHGIVVSRKFSSPSNAIEMIPRVRKAVKEFGKEAATHRFTQEEKQAIAEVVFAYRGQNIRTSENEIARIAINYLVCDYQTNGEKSILHQVLISLNE